MPWWGWLIVGVAGGLVAGGIVGAAGTMLYVGKGMWG
jgi:hypothetical protein